MGKHRSTLADVAKLSKVSTATVSHVINDTRFVSEKIRKRVLLTIKQLHYYPSDIARSLSTKKTETIGIIITDVQNPFYGSLVRGIEEVLQKEKYNILLASNDENASKEEIHLKTFLSKRVDGLIIAPALKDTSFLEVMESFGTKIVLIDRIIKNAPFTSIIVNNKTSSKMMINHVIDDGHKNIGIILGVKQHTSNERFLGYKEALHERNLPIQNEFITEGGSQLKGGYQAVIKLLKQQKKPSAIFSINNLMTLGALYAINEMRLKCPEEIAIVGYDDTNWAPVYTPPLTMIRQPVTEIGMTAAQMILKQLNGEDVPKVVKLDAKLIIRGSCSEQCLHRYVNQKEYYNIREFPFH